MASGNRYRLNSGVSASDGSTKTQQNLNAVVSRPGLQEPFFLDDTLSPSLMCGVNQKAGTSTSSNIVAAGAITDDDNINRLAINDGGVMCVPRGNFWNGADATLGGGTVFTNTTDRIFYVAFVYVWNAAGDCYAALFNAAAAQQIILVRNSVGEPGKCISMAQPIPVYPGWSVRSSATGAQNLQILGWYK